MEKNLKVLQKRLDVVQQEKSQLLQDALAACETIERLGVESETSKLQYDELTATFAVETEEKKELQLELKALYKQFETLKKHVEHHKEKVHDQIQSTQQVQQVLLKAEQKNADLQAEIIRCKEEVGLIKQHLSKGMRDVEKNCKIVFVKLLQKKSTF